MFGDETVLRSLLHLRRSSRYMVDACTAPSGPYVVVKCPGGLSLLACDVEPLEALATAVMDARAALLTSAGEGWRCGDDTPDPLQRRFTALGVGWRDPIRDDVAQADTLAELPPVESVNLSEDGPVWLSSEETAVVMGVSLTTLTANRVAMGLHRHRSGGQFMYKRAEVVAALERRSVA